MRSNISELDIVSQQNEIIRMQSKIVDDLFVLLVQHVTVDDAAVADLIDRISTAAKLCKEIEE